MNEINNIKFIQEKLKTRKPRFQALMYADDIIASIQVGQLTLAKRVEEAMIKMKNCVTGNGLDILPQKSKVIASNSGNGTFKRLGIETVFKTKILGCNYVHGVNSFDIKQAFMDAEKHIHSKIKNLKMIAALPIKLRRTLDNAFLRSKLLCNAPLMMRTILNNETNLREGERLYGYLYRATSKGQNQRGRELWTYIFDGGSWSLI